MKTLKTSRKDGSPSRRTTARRASIGLTALLPLHHRVYVALRRRLAAGTFPLDQPLPGEHRLAAEFKVSRETVRRVLDRLATEDLILRRHGVGTFPSAARHTPVATPQKLAFYDFIDLSSDPDDCQLIDFSEVPTPAEILRDSADFGARSLRISRLRMMERRPEHLIDSYLPSQLAAAVDRRHVGRQTVLELLSEQNIEASASELWVSAVSADAHEAALLQVEIGTPLVHATRVSRDSAGRTIEFSRLHSVADQFGYRFSFDRDALQIRARRAGSRAVPERPSLPAR